MLSIFWHVTTLSILNRYFKFQTKVQENIASVNKRKGLAVAEGRLLESEIEYQEGLISGHLRREVELKAKGEDLDQELANLEIVYERVMCRVGRKIYIYIFF